MVQNTNNNEIDTILYNKLNLEFNDDEQQIFLQHFKGFLNKDNEFIINIEFAFKWIGFTRKDNAKRLLKKHFELNINYTIIDELSCFLPKEEIDDQKYKEGKLNEIILMTPTTFKELALLANTKKGKQVRMYYIKMESIMMKYLSEKNNKLIAEANQKVLEANQLTKNMEYALEIEQNNLAKVLKRNIYKDNPCQVVYIYKESEFKYKVGESNNIARRETDHRCGNTTNQVVYTKKCCNRKLLEKVVHHILDQYRDIKNREWFTVSFDIVKAVLDAAHLFLDEMVDRADTIHSNSFVDKLKELITSLPEIPKQINQNIPIENTIDTNQIIESIETEIELNDVNNPLDFDKFINDCCIKDDNSSVYSVEILAAHRFWCKCAKKTVHDAFYKYLCNNYKKIKVFDENTNAQLSSYKGLKLKPISYKIPNISEDIDQFIKDKCDISYVGRIPSKEIYSAFELWKKDIDNNEYTLCASEKTRIDHGFKSRFLPAVIYNGTEGSRHGYFFVTLKSNSNFIGFKLANKLKKKIVKIDIVTNKIVARFDSLTAAAKSINRAPSTLSTDIIYMRPRDNYIYKYV